jgi:hypothetical protein
MSNPSRKHTGNLQGFSELVGFNITIVIKSKIKELCNHQKNYIVYAVLIAIGTVQVLGNINNTSTCKVFLTL